MTGVMIIFAFSLSLVIGFVERTIIPHDDQFSKRRNKGNSTEPVNGPE
jgi:hypothetical protein